MTNALQKSCQGFSFLFLLNRDVLLGFGVTALALAVGGYFVDL